MQFRVVSNLEGEHLDALIVPVFKEGDAASNAPTDIRATAEWVAREHGDTNMFAPITHLQTSGDGSTRLIVVGSGKRADFDVARAWQFASAGVRALWQSTAVRIALCLESDAIDAQEAVQSAVEGVIYAMWRPESHRTTEKDRQLPPLDEVLLVIGGTPGDYDAAISRGTTSRGIGSRPMTLRASISSRAFITPISAVNAEPERPATMMAVISTPISRTTETATRSMVRSSAP